MAIIVFVNERNFSQNRSNNLEKTVPAVQTSDPQTSDVTKDGQYKHRTGTNVGLVQTSD